MQAIILFFVAHIFAVWWLAIKIPYVTVRTVKIETYALASLIGPFMMIALGYLNLHEFSFLTVGEMNPIVLLVLFFSMTFISIYLDEVGFIEYCARLAISWAHQSAKKLFFALYGVVSVLTIFTSNDIIILTLTPFIFYFTKHARLDPIPYLIAQFVAANTWSVMLQIGNPTNIYITSMVGITFNEYFLVMFLPTVVGGTINLLILYMLFNKRLAQKASYPSLNSKDALKDRTGAIMGVCALGICTLALALSSKFYIPMWKITLVCAIALGAILLFWTNSKIRVLTLIKKMPWSIIPFVFSFFIMVFALGKYGILGIMQELLLGFGQSSTAIIFSYGISSALFSNVLNNIPMSVAFSSILPTNAMHAAAYATTIGSNIGAYFTPIGALAGIMWMSILKDKGIKLSYAEFMAYGFVAGIITLLSMLAVLAYTL